mgnify:FL=1
MKIDVLTLFPDMFNGVFDESIIKRALNNGLVEINVHNIRDYSNDAHKKVDDTPYGGGAGMVLMCQPIFDAVKALRSDNSKVILLTPSGKLYKQSIALDLSHEKHLIIICGHYEGFDERIKTICDMEISIGYYILTGGEIPCMVLIDSITRLIDGVIRKESYENESFSDNLLDYPTYTKPRVYEGLSVPDVLVNGDHAKIDKWRREQQIKLTEKNRPDLLKGDGSVE